MTDRWKETDPKIAEAEWSELEREIAKTLSEMGHEEVQYLILSGKDRAGYVQFAVDVKTSLRVEAMSNNWLPPAHTLCKEQTDAMDRLGWRPPSVVDQGAGKQPSGHANYFLDLDRPIDFEKVAALAVRTLRDVYGFPSFMSIQYLAWGAESGDFELPALAILDREHPVPFKVTLFREPSPAREFLDAVPDKVSYFVLRPRYFRESFDGTSYVYKLLGDGQGFVWNTTMNGWRESGAVRGKVTGYDGSAGTYEITREEAMKKTGGVE